MELTEIIEKQRETYLKSLEEFYNGRHKGARELLLGYNSKNSGIWLNMSRMDYVEQVGEDYTIEEFSPDTYLNHPRLDYVLDELAIELRPIFWHGCSFDVSPRPNSWETIEAWVSKWLDGESTFANTDSERSNAVHSVTVPETTAGRTTFTVDFGTAPIESFMELLKTLNDLGVKRVVIHSNDLTN